MKKTFYLMRHGQTLFNVRRKIQGWCDSPLTEKGIQQAEQVANFFDNIQLDYLYSSTSERSCDTAEIVTRNRMPYQRLKGLKEINFGVYEGESEDLHPSKDAREEHYVQFGGESRDMIRKRMRETCIDIMEKDGHNCVLAVAHAGSCRRFLEQWTDADAVLPDGIPNCCVFEYQYADKQFTFVQVHQLVD
ncbi:histidine phosphatase family protein [Vibrio sp.]|uniref:Histidine phosphatase family protein n=1 Tax=Vibrio viridaestus TaxID=2487322 RepID=A0A3N9TLK6_9VIBR|nr:histidine phosphatase family protein [Vibrio viridaestus]MDC0612431.1 histidine phosphatase family protein [Vibrio sp.]RQW65011.1 histidine phosphatase family protein [Vibrio viridaestus]